MKNKIIFFIILLTFSFYNINQNAKEILIYADDIYYDNNQNLIAKGNAKIISGNEIITSDLIIYDKKEVKIILPTKFAFKDEKNNYYYGTSGEFTENFHSGEINDVKIYLYDGSRIVGKSFSRDGHIDIVNKGVYSPCTSRISIKDFKCPIWQLDGEKILHDNEKLILYQKN